MATKHCVYRGWIQVDDYGGNSDALFLVDRTARHRDWQPLAEDAAYDMPRGATVSARYFITDTERTREELDDRLIRFLEGDASIDYGDAYSEITGYLWTDEYLKIGGHDLIAELRSHEGKFCHLELDFHTAA